VLHYPALLRFLSPTRTASPGERPRHAQAWPKIDKQDTAKVTYSPKQALIWPIIDKENNVKCAPPSCAALSSPNPIPTASPGERQARAQALPNTETDEHNVG